MGEPRRLPVTVAVDVDELRRFVDSFCDDEAGEVEHVVAADGTSGFALTGGNDAHAVLRKAASALLPGRSEAEVKAEAWDEAVSEAFACGYLHDPAREDMLARNPYRKDADRG